MENTFKERNEEQLVKNDNEQKFATEWLENDTAISCELIPDENTFVG